MCLALISCISLETKIRIMFYVRHIFGMISQAINVTTVLIFPSAPTEKCVTISMFSAVIVYHVVFLIIFNRTAKSAMELVKYLTPFQISNSALIFVLSASFWVTHILDFETVNYPSGIVVEAMLHSLSQMAIFSICKTNPIQKTKRKNRSNRRTEMLDVRDWTQTARQHLSSIDYGCGDDSSSFSSQEP